MLDPMTSLTAKPSNGSSSAFAPLGLATPILQALEKAGYNEPTPIQAAAIAPAITGRDLLLSAQTGSGKTAAFVLPILHRLAQIDDKQRSKQVRAVILTPTRELALQVYDNVRKYGSRLKHIAGVALVGGASYGGQIRALRTGVQIIVATPGRFIDHMEAGRIVLDGLEILVMDEADRMLDMGFSDAIDTILANMPASRQTIMSSATWDGAVGKIAASFTSNPQSIAIKAESAHIEESVYFCDDFYHKNHILYNVLDNTDIQQAMIFASTKISTEQLANDLLDKGYKAQYLHGDLPQSKRNRIVSDVKAGKYQFLIATDVAARGIDIATISHVINYDLPRQAEDYVHRIGRCGRAGRTGRAINLCSADDRRQFFAINRYLGREMAISTIAGLEPKHKFEDRDSRSRRDNRKYKARGKDYEGCKASLGRSHRPDKFGAERFVEGKKSATKTGTSFKRSFYANDHKQCSEKWFADSHRRPRPAVKAGGFGNTHSFGDKSGFGTKCSCADKSSSKGDLGKKPYGKSKTRHPQAAQSQEHIYPVPAEFGKDKSAAKRRFVTN